MGFYVILDGPPSGEDSGRFVEIENEHGRSQSPATTGAVWQHRADGGFSLGPFATHAPADPRQVAVEALHAAQQAAADVVFSPEDLPLEHAAYGTLQAQIALAALALATHDMQVADRC